MIPQAAPIPSLLPVAALILAIWGAVVDWRYKRKGGKKPSKRDRLLFLVAFALVGAFFGVLALIGNSGGADVAGLIGMFSADFTLVLFATWELGRWRVRSKNPLPQSQNAVR
jgi:drug/metabolite transporter (DMT)-like permease